MEIKVIKESRSGRSEKIYSYSPLSGLYISIALTLHMGRETDVCVADTEGPMKPERPVRRGDIYIADLPDKTVGSVQVGTRPVLVTQNDRINEHAPTVLVATVTSVIKRLDLKTHVLLPMIKGLPKQSMVMAEQRYTLDKKSLKEYRCHLPDEVMKKVDRAIKYAESGSYHHKQRRRRSRT